MGWNLAQDYIVYTLWPTSKSVNGAYQAGVLLGPDELVEEKNQLQLYVHVALAGGTGFLKVEFSDDNITYYQETSSYIAAPPGAATSIDRFIEHEFDTSGNYRIAIPIKDRYIKVSIKVTGAGEPVMSVKGILGID